MILDYETLKLVWWLLVGVLLIGFVITDGFDMGAGALLPFLGRSDEERRVIINTLGPHWDGNQVWFITAGGAIFAAWPAVYAAAFSGFYVAMLLVLFALFFRPVGFDYRSKVEDPRWRSAWDWGLFVGGAVPALLFGVAFGNLILGVPFEYDTFLRPTYTGSFFGLLRPFALLAGVVSLSMLIMHGATWLQLRAGQPIEARARKTVMVAGSAVIVSFGVAGIWLALGIPGYEIVSMPATDALPNPLAKEVVQAEGAWMANYGRYPWMILAPMLGFVGALGAILMAGAKRPGLAFTSSAASMSGIIFTAGFSMFPFIMPSITVPDVSLTMWDAPSSHLTLTVMFWAAVIFVPIILAYTVWCYRALWGRTTVEFIREHNYDAY
ncbi:cytochrome d ubiquinol oxidase subunit II [Thiohalomonas denitrificans]|uniref:cytochrome d ubiquinol oxidase subunit II n=1 Tax=Thiohalomonas denitrificans TaxID=415747 RepID=UPI0026ECA4BF|nr:cytochrome d ubiquinol oxidase subunit II [Thiohalomonas denitrificans]